jgi:hypothetical protein
MKKILTAIAAAVFFVFPSICFASYVIHLKDRRKVVTNQYLPGSHAPAWEPVPYAFPYQTMGAGETHKIMDVPLFTYLQCPWL